MAAPKGSALRMSEIKSKLLQPALTSHFICGFQPPGGKLGRRFEDFIRNRVGAGFVGADYNNRTNLDLITLSCSEASLPGSSLATHEITNDFSGVTERHAYRRQYDDRADFTFYVDKEYRIIDFFENWISFVVGEDDLKNQVDPNYFYRMNFPNIYKTTNLYITKFERDYSGRNLVYQFINAYPISINSIPVSYDSSQLLKCTVAFTYSRYVMTKPRSVTNDEIRSAVAAGVEAGYAAAAQAISSAAQSTPAINNQSSVNNRPRTRGQVLGYE